MARDWDKSQKDIAEEAALQAKQNTNIMNWRMAHERAYLPELLGGARQMMVDEYNRPQAIGTSDYFQPTGLVNRQRYSPEDYRLDVTVPEVEREEEVDPSDPPDPPPPIWTPPPGYEGGNTVFRPRTDEELDPEALYRGTQGQLPYNAVATGGEDEVDIAALMGGTQGQLPYGAVATDDPRDAIDWAGWAGLGDIMAGTRIEEPFDAQALYSNTQGQLPYGVISTDGEELDIASLMNGTQGQLPYGISTDENDVDIASMMMGTQGQLPYNAISTDGNELDVEALMSRTQGKLPYNLNPQEEQIKADLAAWQAIAPSSYTRTDDTYSRQGINGNDAALAAYGAQGGPPELSIYGQEALLGPGMAMSAYNLPNMSMGAAGAGAGPSGSGGDGGQGSIPIEMEKFANSNPQIMGKANLVPAQYTQFIEANTGVPTRGMSAIQFDDWMNGNDVVVQGRVIPFDPKLVAEIRSSDGAEDALSVLSQWAAQHRQDEFKRQGGALGAASGPIDIGMGRFFPETSEVRPPVEQVDIDELSTANRRDRRRV